MLKFSPQASWSPRTAIAFFVLLLGCLSLIYLPTILYPYLLTDELWIIRPNTYSWTYSMGRPLFSFFAALAAWVNGNISLAVIYVMRLSAVCGLALSGLYLARWFEVWGHTRRDSFFLAIAVMTLPAYQIVVADGTQLAWAILFAVSGTYYFFLAFLRQSWLGCLAAGLLMIAALLTYQQQLLVSFAMLCIPLLRRRFDSHTYKFILLHAAFLSFISILYFVGWKITYRLLWPGRIDTRYGPDAVQFPSLGQLRSWAETRIVQVANLWDVGGVPSTGVIFGIVIALILAKTLSDLRFNPRFSAINYTIMLCLLPATDGFSILARAYPSYITTTALGLAIFYWAVSGAGVLLSKARVNLLFLIAVLGSFLAFMTVKNEVAVPNWRQMNVIEQAIFKHETALNFHIVGAIQGGPGYQEFGWRNSATDVYLHLMTINVADHLTRTGKISEDRRSNMYFSFGGMATLSAPHASRPTQPRADSVYVVLE